MIVRCGLIGQLTSSPTSYVQMSDGFDLCGLNHICAGAKYKKMDSFGVVVRPHGFGPECIITVLAAFSWCVSRRCVSKVNIVNTRYGPSDLWSKLMPACKAAIACVLCRITEAVHVVCSSAAG